MNISKEFLEKIILDSIKQLANEFQKDELAYLALTSKIENPIRDKWAYIMQKKLKEQKISVAREWKRSDIAIVQNNYPFAIIELKAMYTFDALRPSTLSSYLSNMELDEEKAKNLANDNTLANDDTLIYTVLLTTHPALSVPEKLKSVIAYSSPVNASLNKFNSSEIYKQAKNNIENSLQHKNIVAQEMLVGGNAFDIDTNVAYWIIRA